MKFLDPRKAYPVMDPKEFRIAIKKLGFTQNASGPWMGLASRTTQGWCLGETAVHQPVAMLLRMMVALGVTAEEAKLFPTCEDSTPPTKKQED